LKGVVVLEQGVGVPVPPRVNPSGRYKSYIYRIRGSLSNIGRRREPKDVKKSTPTQQPIIPWSSLLRQRPRQ